VADEGPDQVFVNTGRSYHEFSFSCNIVDGDLPVLDTSSDDPTRRDPDHARAWPRCASSSLDLGVHVGLTSPPAPSSSATHNLTLSPVRLRMELQRIMEIRIVVNWLIPSFMDRGPSYVASQDDR
jgi:hypothetical protein